MMHSGLSDVHVGAAVRGEESKSVDESTTSAENLRRDATMLPEYLKQQLHHAGELPGLTILSSQTADVSRAWLPPAAVVAPTPNEYGIGLSLPPGDTVGVAPAPREGAERPPVPTPHETGSDNPFIKSVSEFKAAFDHIYPRLDHDKNGGVTLSAIDNAMGNPSFRGSDAQVLAGLKSYFSDISHLDRSSGLLSFLDSKTISLKAIAKFEHAVDQTLSGKQTDSKLSDLVMNLRSVMVIGPSIIGSQCQTLYAKNDSQASIRPDAVHSPYAVGDCYFEAGMASMAATRPEAIRDMIKQNNDGTFTVTFPGAPHEPTTVSAPTQAELAFYGGATDKGLWPWVLRKAYGKYCNQSFLRRDSTNIFGGGTDLEGADGGSSHDDGIRMLTGHGVRKDHLSVTSYSEVSQHLNKAINNPDAHQRQLVTASIWSLGGHETKDNFRVGHDYSIIGFKPNFVSPMDSKITVRDPISSDGGGSGTREISLKMLAANFSTLDYEK